MGIDGAYGEKVGGHIVGVKEDEGKEQGERDREGDDDSGADAGEEENEDDENEYHAAEEIGLDRVGGEADEVAAVVEGADFDIRGKNVVVELPGFLFDALEDRLGLFTAAHEDDAFDGSVNFVEAQFAEARAYLATRGYPVRP